MANNCRTDVFNIAIIAIKTENIQCPVHSANHSFLYYTPNHYITRPDIRKKLIYNPHRKSYIIVSRDRGLVQQVLSAMPPALTDKTLYVIRI